MRVGVIGLGVIGSAQTEMFSEHTVVAYDTRDGARGAPYPSERLFECDMILICVGTPEAEDGSADLRYLESAVAELPVGVPVAVRSTVPPGTTDRLLAGKGRMYAHVPEFMGENVLHSWQRPQDVPYMIIGGSDAEAALYFQYRFAEVFPGAIHTCSVREAEMAKYLANLYWATRVTFVNEMALVAEALGVDFERARAAWLSDPRMTDVYTQRAGYPPGFDGRCWPKDLNALIRAAQDAGCTAGFLRAVREANRGFRSDGEGADHRGAGEPAEGGRGPADRDPGAGRPGG